MASPIEFQSLQTGQVFRMPAPSYRPNRATDGQRPSSLGEPTAPEVVEVTPQMIKAGLEELRDLLQSGADIIHEKEYLVSSIYMAMEYERRDGN